MNGNGHGPINAMDSPIVFADVFELEKIADVLASCAATLSNAGFAETASLVRMARMDLVSRINGITDEELRSVASLVSLGQSVLRLRRQ